ncbi:MAG: peptidyl-alpha-hydroxyglycine alpha-amidating lyase family protein [Vicinamibacterales bacterium]
MLRVRRVTVGADAIRVRRGLRPWPRRYPRPPYDTIIALQNTVHLGRGGLNAVPPTASPMLTAAEARWVASELRHALKETSMRTSLIALVLIGSVATAAAAQPGAAPRNDLPQPYRTERDWGELPPGVAWAAVTAIESAPDGSLYVVHRCFENSCAGRPEAPILKYDASGRLLASFGQGLLVFPHGGTVDHEGNLWISDAGSAPGLGHQLLKFAPDGRVLMRLGEAGVSGSGPDHFDQPTDIVVADDGDLFVTDSHRNGRNNRVVHFRPDGTFVAEWGRKGSGPGEFSEPHTIAIDSRGRLFVGDRENNRIQIFDQSGRFLEEWRQFGRPSGIAITADDRIYVADSESWAPTRARTSCPASRRAFASAPPARASSTRSSRTGNRRRPTTRAPRVWAWTRRGTSTAAWCGVACWSATS